MAMEMIKKCICRGSPSRETGTNGIKKEKWNHESWLVNHKEYQRELQRVSTTIIATSLYQNLESTEPKKMS